MTDTPVPNPVSDPIPFSPATPKNPSDVVGQPTPGTPAGSWIDSADWHASLPDDLKGDVNVVRYKTPKDALTALVGAQKRLGVPQERLLVVPEKSRADDPEGWAAIDRVTGVPAKVEDYGIKLPDAASDFDKTTFNDFATKMHAAGATKAQMDVATAEFARAMQVTAVKSQADQAKKLEEGKAAIEAHFGDKLDTYRTEITGKLLHAKDAKGQPILSDDEIKQLDGDLKDHSLPFMKVLAHAMDLIAEPETLEGNNAGGANPSRGMTPSQAQAARLVLEADPVKGKALLNKNDPLHAQVVEERRKLLALENPQKPS